MFDTFLKFHSQSIAGKGIDISSHIDLPQNCIDFWKTYGGSVFSDGLIQLINPTEYRSTVNAFLGKDSKAIPLFLFGFGDMLLFDNGAFMYLDCLYFKYSKLSKQLQIILDYNFVKDEYLSEVLFSPLFNEAKQKLGPLSLNEVFTFVPALPLGGSEKLEFVQKGNAVVYQNILGQLGKI